MGSFIFKPQHSNTRQQRFGFEYSIIGKGLPRKQPLSGCEVLELKPCEPNTFPTGTDRKAPRLPGGK